MDPQATWDELQEAYAEEDGQRVRELGQALHEWLDRGGFPPRTTQGRARGEAWDRAIARCVAAVSTNVRTRPEDREDRP
jgi:hypothetical protein